MQQPAALRDQRSDAPITQTSNCLRNHPVMHSGIHLSAHSSTGEPNRAAIPSLSLLLSMSVCASICFSVWLWLCVCVYVYVSLVSFTYLSFECCHCLLGFFHLLLCTAGTQYCSQTYVAQIVAAHGEKPSP